MTADSPTSADDPISVAIEDFIRTVGDIADDDPDFSRDIDLFDTGYLDSLGLIALTNHLEDTYAVPITEQDLFDPAFTTINGIARLIAHDRPTV